MEFYIHIGIIDFEGEMSQISHNDPNFCSTKPRKVIMKSNRKHSRFDVERHSI